MQTNIAYSFAEPAVIDPRGFTSSNAFDALGRVVQATNTDGITVTVHLIIVFGCEVAGNYDDVVDGAL